MEAPRGTQMRPERAERIKAVKWVPISQARKTLSYKNVRPVLLRALEIINTKIKPHPKKSSKQSLSQK